MGCTKAIFHDFRRFFAQFHSFFKIPLLSVNLSQQMHIPDIHTAFAVTAFFSHFQCFLHMKACFCIFFLFFEQFAHGCISIRTVDTGRFFRLANLQRLLITAKCLILFLHLFIEIAQTHQTDCHLLVFFPQQSLFLVQRLHIQRQCFFIFFFACIVHTQIIQCIGIKSMLLGQHFFHQFQHFSMDLNGLIKLICLTADSRQRIQAVHKIQMVFTEQFSADIYCFFTVFHSLIQKVCFFTGRSQCQHIHHIVEIICSSRFFDQIQTDFIIIDGFFIITFAFIGSCRRTVQVCQIQCVKFLALSCLLHGLAVEFNGFIKFLQQFICIAHMVQRMDIVHMFSAQFAVTDFHDLIMQGKGLFLFPHIVQHNGHVVQGVRIGKAFTAVILFQLRRFFI